MNITKSNNYLKVGYYAVLTLALICILAFLPLTAHAAGTPDIVVDDSWSGTGNGAVVTYDSVNYTFGTDAFESIQEGIDAASDSQTVLVVAGTYNISSPITIQTNLSLVGENPADFSDVKIIANPTMNDTAKESIIEITDPAVGDALTAVNISNLTVDGVDTSIDILNGIYSEVPLIIDNVNIKNISNTDTGVGTPGMGMYLKDSATISSIEMSDIGRYGIFIWEEVSKTNDSSIDGFIYVGKGSGTDLDYGIEVAAGATCVIDNTSITDCEGVALDTSASSAIVASTYSGSGTLITVDNSVLSNNIINVAIGYDAADETSFTISNTDLVPASGGTNIDSFSITDSICENNWWGTYLSESAVNSKIVAAANVDVIPFLMGANPADTSDDYLESITTSTGSLTPAFQPLTLTYDVEVVHTTETITITPTLLHSGSAITVDSISTASGAASDPVSLSYGNNPILVVVGSTTYTLNVYRQYSSYLSALSITDTTNPISFTPAFVNSTFDYIAYVDDTVTNVDIAATAENVSEAVVVGEGSSLALNAAPADTVFTITVNTSDSVTQDYTITVKRFSDDASLSDIKINGATITGFSPTTYSYTPSYNYSVDEAVLLITTEDNNATYEVNGGAILASYPLTVGSGNIFTISVTAQDGVATQDYIVTVTREAQVLDNASLSAITVDGTPVAGFDANTLTYTINVDASAVSVDVVATPDDILATVDGDGVNILNTNSATTLIGLEVTAQDTVTTKTYTLTIVKQVTDDASLSDLKVAGSTITGFAADKYAYVLTVDGKTTSTIDVAATANDGSATVTGTGTKNLNYGENIITVHVAASDGIASQDYVITVTRTGGDNAKLSYIKIGGTIIDGFSPTTLKYTIYVDNSTNNVALTADTDSLDATLSGTGTIPLTVGNNTVDIDVTAPDGVTEKRYTLTIVRSGDNSVWLKDITIDSATIQGFNHETYEYVLSVPQSKANIAVGAVALDNTAVITGTGTINLAIGGNDINIKVVSGNGVNTITYKLTIYRGYNADATLHSITIDGSKIASFNPYYYDYTVNVKNSVKSVALWAETTDEYASVTGLGNKSLSVGTNKYTLKVTADNDTTTKDYVLRIVRAQAESSSSSGSSDSGNSDSSGSGSDSSDSTDTNGDDEDS